MLRVFLSGAPEERLISGSDAAHITRVLRLRPGDTLIVCDGTSGDYPAIIESIDKAGVWVSYGEYCHCTGEPETEVIMYLAWTKGERLEWAVQKCVELGAGGIRLFSSVRCVQSPGAGKLERLNRIAAEAASQCGRGRLISVTNAGRLSDTVAEPSGGLRLFCYEGGGLPLGGLIQHDTKRVCCMTGPEGGFEEREAELARESGWTAVSLGKRILRAETAPVAALSAIMSILDW